MCKVHHLNMDTTAFDTFMSSKAWYAWDYEKYQYEQGDALMIHVFNEQDEKVRDVVTQIIKTTMEKNGALLIHVALLPPIEFFR
ncbi:hypothetical protein [Xenorhabdus littoralis]|uniref:hypothetical protein n=1 Tax=Xenorhabdus littoralis TaxID=2582835 RepID=UPI0029E80E03|nr:hypothetical protein [Xenorhabdus sp. psl]MDX7990797.1 hypothetical protein [Xenorhabdus sp. psl]